MIEEIVNIITNWTSNNEKIFHMGDAILFLIFLVSVLYLFVFALFSQKKKTYTYPAARRKYRFAVLFPAYKEDAVILHSVEDFLKNEYPRDLYDVVVISDQMSEETNKKLLNLSAKVVEITNFPSTKTNALRKAVEYIDNGMVKYDIIVILDADNLTDNDFLEKINDAFYSGCSAVQTHRVAKNRDTNIAVLDAVSEEINNSIFRKGHTQIGFSSALIGSGMAFEYELFKECIMSSKHIGVDKQLEQILLLQNIYIEYLEVVYTYDEKVANKNSFYDQRRRWLSNQFHNLFYGLKNIPLAILKGNWDYCNKLFQWMMPPRIILFGLIVIIAVIMTAVDWPLSIKWWGLLLLLCITFSLAVPDYLVDSRLKKALASLPLIFMLMCLNFFRLKGANKEFIHTQHSDTSNSSNTK
ncbi:glycosyltransferase family 2 protein [Parabacteroides gordonii]|uniref:glycosyltransferase n=1 Tax=Parabacteroides gordonii TaxID=574930 RepID=UPI0026EED908|nr:glycosyltransferase family 2 protein [Parabacteroides gordonii]